MKVLFCQISNNLINSPNDKSPSSQYYNSIYELHKEDGYVRPEHFWEIPLWIAELSYIIENKELHIVEDIQASINYINNSDVDMVLFSVLDVNKDIVNSIVQNIIKRVYYGGYTKMSSNKAHYFASVKDFCSYFGFAYKKGTDYSLFKGYSTIPRLQLSTGCFHICKFCTVPKKVIENDYTDILQSVWSLKDLNFKLVYIDDKTFGQTPNHIYLDSLGTYIKSWNPEFKGFIIQTSAFTFIKKLSLEKLKCCHIFAVELGVESYNNKILQSLAKPANESAISSVVGQLHNTGIKFIANLIIGLPGENKETYEHTLNFVERVKPYALNVYNLALYEDSILTKELGIVDNEKNENVVERSYNSKEQNQLNKWFEESLYTLGLKQLK